MYKDKPFHIGTVRFTNKTYQENLEWKARKNHKGCIYGLDTKVTNTVNKGSYIFVMEMNNDKNKIQGIGFIKNKNHIGKYHKIYKDGNYNRYIYKSSRRVDRKNLDREQKKTIRILRGSHESVSI